MAIDGGQVLQSLSVLIVLEYSLSPVPLRRHVIEGTRVFYPERTGHEGNLPRDIYDCKT